MPNEQDEGELGGFSWLGECDEEESVAPGEWTPQAKRCGAIARKVGMMAMYDVRGVKTVCTVVQIDHCQVMEVKKYISGRGTPRINLALGAGVANPRLMKKCDIVPFRKAGIPPKRIVRDFQVSLDAVLPVGHTMDVRHFVPGQFVDIVGTSRGKGFQGAIKRWKFHRQTASHGNSLSHRAIGSTGTAQTPGKVRKGKKMAGRMGGNRCTFLSMLIYKIDAARNLVFIKGTVPGPNRAYITIKDAVREPFIVDHPPPFPTYKPKPGDELITEYVMDVSHLPDPYAEVSMKGH
jgi:large subunit ribosomal protein L3